jgi:hypothetical protein
MPLTTTHADACPPHWHNAGSATCGLQAHEDSPRASGYRPLAGREAARHSFIDFSGSLPSPPYRPRRRGRYLPRARRGRFWNARSLRGAIHREAASGLAPYGNAARPDGSTVLARGYCRNVRPTAALRATRKPDPPTYRVRFSSWNPRFEAVSYCAPWGDRFVIGRGTARWSCSVGYGGSAWRNEACARDDACRLASPIESNRGGIRKKR